MPEIHPNWTILSLVLFVWINRDPPVQQVWPEVFLCSNSAWGISFNFWQSLLHSSRSANNRFSFCLWNFGCFNLRLTVLLADKWNKTHWGPGHTGRRSRFAWKPVLFAFCVNTPTCWGTEYMFFLPFAWSSATWASVLEKTISLVFVQHSQPTLQHTVITHVWHAPEVSEKVLVKKLRKKCGWKRQASIWAANRGQHWSGKN